MYRANDSEQGIDMISAPALSTGDRPTSASYAASRSARTRPTMSLATLWNARQSRALQLSWMGLVRR